MLKLPVLPWSILLLFPHFLFQSACLQLNKRLAGDPNLPYWIASVSSWEPFMQLANWHQDILLWALLPHKTTTQYTSSTVLEYHIGGNGLRFGECPIQDRKLQVSALRYLMYIPKHKDTVLHMLSIQQFLSPRCPSHSRTWIANTKICELHKWPLRKWNRRCFYSCSSRTYVDRQRERKWWFLVKMRWCIHQRIKRHRDLIQYWLGYLHISSRKLSPVWRILGLLHDSDWGMYHTACNLQHHRLVIPVSQVLHLIQKRAISQSYSVMCYPCRHQPFLSRHLDNRQISY